MADPFIAEIIMFGGNYAPPGWALCDGQLLAVSQNSALFSILGTTYGGDGETTFGLPDLRGRVPMHPGTGPGLSPRRLGAKGGAETHTLSVQQIPQHNHAVSIPSQSGPGIADDPDGQVVAAADSGANLFHNTSSGTLKSFDTGNTGGSQSHNNIQPFQCVNFIIALVGIYPSP